MLLVVVADAVAAVDIVDDPMAIAHQYGPMRPWELAWAEWYMEKNLIEYLEIAKDVMLTAGVAKINPDFWPGEMYSQEIIITVLERIFSYDEIRMELDCTKPEKGKGDCFMKGSGKEDDGEVIATKSSRTATTVCGRLRNGMPLPVYMGSRSVRIMMFSGHQKIPSQIWFTTFWTRTEGLSCGAMLAT